MLQLGTILHSRGFDISIAHTRFHAPSSENHPNFEFISLPDSLSDELISSGNVSAILVAVNANFNEPLQDCLKERGKVACIIYDELMWSSEAVANSLGLSSIMLRTNTVSAQLGRNLVMQLMRDGVVPLQDSILEQPVPEHYPLRYKDLPTSIFQPLSNFVKSVNNLREVRSSSAVIWNTMNCLEKSLLEKVKQQCQVPIFTVGPMHKFAPPISTSLLKEDYTCIPWLDQQASNSVIYVSLGSLACISETELAEMAWGLANSNIPFLWVVRPGLVRGTKNSNKLPKGFKQAVGDRGRIVQWAPQKEVLAHDAVGGFWTHCGWNSTMESIAEGVPLVCRPNFADQKVTARYVTHVWRVGFQLEGDELEREEVGRILRRLMIGEEGEEIRRRAEEVKGKVEIETRKGGSSVNDLDELVAMIRSF
ncbi:UDP-glucose iridoid glucosyltransferase [Linum grandiflorum]